jgi:large subunit ribosomal protein L32
MPVPKKRVSRTRRDKRRTHKKITPVNVIKCPQCGENTLPHRVCGQCGFYRGRAVLPVAE